MNIRSNVAEFRRADKRIIEGEADAEQARWDQARLAFDACTAEKGGLTQAEYAASVGKSTGHISMLIRMWRRVEDKVHRGEDLPHFGSTYETMKIGQATTSTAARLRRHERQAPSQKKDQVEMLQKLIIANPDAVDEALDDPVVKNQLRQRVDEDEAKAKARRTKAAKQAKADPAGKVVRDAITKMDLYARALDMMADEWIYALEDVPPDLKVKLAKAAGKLEASAHRFVEATKGRRALRAVK